MQVNIQKIEVITKTSPRTGKPYKQIEMFTAQHGQKKLTKFVDKDDKALYWRAGDTVNIVEIPNGNFMNFAVEDLKTNANSGAVVSPTIERLPPLYVPKQLPQPAMPISSTGLPINPIPQQQKVDRNYALLLRIAQHVGVQLTDEEINSSLGF